MITSMTNPRVRHVVQLREKSRERNKEKLFVAEGIRMCLEVPPDLVQELYVTEEVLHSEEGHALQQKLKACQEAGAFTETVTAEVMQKMADTVSPQGVLAVTRQLSYDGLTLIQKAADTSKTNGKRPLFLILEDIQDPGNLGTMLRTAEGAGADGIFLTDGTVDMYNPKTIRSTMGALFRVPFVTHCSIPEVIALLKEAQITVYAAHLKGQQYYHEMDYAGGSAFLIGNEGNGLKEESAELADVLLKIPMDGQLESLNAAVAAALLMYRCRY